MRRTIVAVCLAMVAAACGQEDAPGAGPTMPAPSPAGTSPEPASPTPEEGVTIDSAESDLGTILTDADGRTLYVFLSDSEGESTCYQDCAQSWPALETEGDPVAGEGVEASLLGTAERTDGALQVTYGGSPLYYFADDAEAGETNGQGIGDVWFVISPEGEPVRD
jgi:predicted lipoprotein with Yx(FWY)xxD motif